MHTQSTTIFTVNVFGNQYLFDGGTISAAIESAKGLTGIMIVKVFGTSITTNQGTFKCGVKNDEVLTIK